MVVKKEKKTVFENLKNVYRLVVYNDTTFAELWKIRLSRLNVFAYGGIFFILVVALVFVLLVYSPLNIFLPACQDSKMQHQILQNALRLDSLQYELDIRDKYLKTVKAVIEGKEPEIIADETDTTQRYSNILFEKSAEDSLLRLEIEKEELYNLSVAEDKLTDNSISSMHFFAPINKGLITNDFNLEQNHFGTDIVAEPNSGIMSTLDGTITMATWTLETGNVI